MGKIDIASLIKRHEHLVYEMATYKWASALTEISNDDYGKIKPQVAQLAAWRKKHIGRSKRVDELTAVKFCARLEGNIGLQLSVRGMRKTQVRVHGRLAMRHMNCLMPNLKGSRMSWHSMSKIT